MIVQEESGPIRSSAVDELALSLDGRLLASLHNDGTVCLWDALSGTYIGGLPAQPRSRRQGLKFSADSKHVIFRAYEAEGLFYWDLESGEEVLGLPPGERTTFLSDKHWICERRGLRSVRRVMWVNSGGEQTQV
jgi:WD40 repeat protein